MIRVNFLLPDCDGFKRKTWDYLWRMSLCKTINLDGQAKALRSSYLGETSGSGFCLPFESFQNYQTANARNRVLDKIDLWSDPKTLYQNISQIYKILLLQKISESLWMDNILYNMAALCFYVCSQDSRRQQRTGRPGGTTKYRNFYFS